MNPGFVEPGGFPGLSEVEGSPRVRRPCLAEAGRYQAGAGVSDLDLGALPAPGRVWDVDERVLMTAAFEGVFPAPRVDLIVLSEAPPFLALAAVSGELLFACDRVREANYQLYVMRRAGDLAPFERARRAHLLATTR